MKKVCCLFLFITLFGKGFSQSCISLGCAANYATQTTDGTLADSSGTLLGGCYNSATYKQIFWQFFFSPSGGDFTQTYTPVNSGGGMLDLDYLVYDMGTSPTTTSISCPENPGTWTLLICNNHATFDIPTGPGVAGTGGNVLTTVAGHYYAIAIVSWQGTSNAGDASYTFTIGTPQLGGVNLTPANCTGVLPVTLSSFNARVNNCIVDLDWTSQSQSDFKNYEVEYSNDGSQFQTIATIAGVPQGSDQKYTYQHNNPQQGNIYYRLKMTDIDGKFEYSKIIALKLNCNRSSIMVYPNPVTNNILNINITNLQNEVTIASLFDIDGKLIYAAEMSSGTNVINMEKFAKGIYWLRLKNNTETQNIKIIK